MHTILLIMSNQPDNLGDIIQNRNIIQNFKKYGKIFVDDYYIMEKHLYALDITQEHLLSNNRHLPNFRNLSG